MYKYTSWTISSERNRRIAASKLLRKAFIYDVQYAVGQRITSTFIELINNMRNFPDDLISDEFVKSGYSAWIVEYLPGWLPFATPTRRQYAKLLQSLDWRVRVAWAHRYDLKPYKSQYSAGLEDKVPEVRRAWVGRDDLTPTRAQYAKGLKDKSWKVREAWARRGDLQPSITQFEAGLTDTHPRVREAWARRIDLLATDEQRERGKKDPNPEVRWVWQHDRSIIEHQMGRLK